VAHVDAQTYQFVMRGLDPRIRVIASEAKQSSAELPHWIASSLRSSQ
jgi:hypothetical protein